MPTLADNLRQLGVRFLVDQPTGTVRVATRDNNGMLGGMNAITETPAQLLAAGVDPSLLTYGNFRTSDDFNSAGVQVRGIGVGTDFRSSTDPSKGEIQNLADLQSGYINPQLQNLANAASPTAERDQQRVGAFAAQVKDLGGLNAGGQEALRTQNAVRDRLAAEGQLTGVARQQAIEAQARVPVQSTPTPIDNVIDAEDFVSEGSNITVGDVPNLQVGTASPIFFDPSNPSALFYVPSGSNQPVRISSPEQLQQLAASGVIEINGARQPLTGVSSFLKEQTVSGGAPTSQDQGLLEGIGGTQGGYQGLFTESQKALEPFNKAVQDIMAQIGGFQFTDLDAYATSLESSNKINTLLDQLASTDSQIAEINNIARRVPETTLQAIQGTEVTQGILDRQRTEELTKLSNAQAPLIELKTALEADLTRRQDLIDRRIQNKKDMDSQNFQLLGTYLDMAVANRTIAADAASDLFNAASADYEQALKTADDAREAAIKAEEDKVDALTEFYKAQGYVIDPMTGELASTLERQKMVSGSGGGTSGGLSAIAQAVLSGTLKLTDITPTQRGNIAQELLNAGYQAPSPLSAGQETDLADMDTIFELVAPILDTYNTTGDIPGIGFLTGPVEALGSKIFGSGTDEERANRANISNIKATIAKLRGGTSFTANEQKLLESYIPSINESPESVASKLRALNNFIAVRKQNLLNTSQTSSYGNLSSGAVDLSTFNFSLEQ